MAWKDAVPPPPDGVKYALTVPQSVLFADLSLRGSQRHSFVEAMGFDYEPKYIAIDDGAMSWDISANDEFVDLLRQEGAEEGIEYFIDTIGSTSRNLTRIASVVGPGAMRRRSSVSDVVSDLRQYWHAYELHMTNLFTFWNVEALLSEVAVDAFSRAGLTDAVRAGLAEYLRPNETNYFALERKNLERIRARFGTEQAHDHSHSSPLLKAADCHAKVFGFLLAPFNLGEPPTASHVLHRIAEMGPPTAEPADTTMLTSIEEVRYQKLPATVRRLARIARRLTFWKTERLDVLARTDDAVRELYQDAANVLDISLNELFAMRRSEIDEALEGGSVASTEELTQRQQGFALVLVNSSIDLYTPSKNRSSGMVQALPVGSILEGIGASRGTVTGPVRIVTTTDSSSVLPGEVLVTAMTRPEMGAALDRAAAFVTDEGGLMCHAAIISREMKKPCVIGTGEATTLLSNKMMVEVNGDRGTVEVVSLDDMS